MKTIKFRGWDKKEKKMYPLVVVESDGSWSPSVIDDDWRVEGAMQYIGRKDNKRTKKYPEGQEIYEGDILRQFNQGYDGEADSYSYFQVKFGETPEGRYGYYLESGSDSLVFYEDFSDLEVIGNICENEGLLK